MDKYHLTVLFWVSHDYETVDTIIGNVSEDLDSKITESELFGVLSELRSSSLVQAYKYGGAESGYAIESSPDKTQLADIWWLITSKGREALAVE